MVGGRYICGLRAVAHLANKFLRSDVVAATSVDSSMRSYFKKHHDSPTLFDLQLHFQIVQLRSACVNRGTTVYSQ